MLLNDKQIFKLANEGMISPFVKRQQRYLVVNEEIGKRVKVPSFGLTTAGYDLRLCPNYGISQIDRGDAIDILRGNIKEVLRPLPKCYTEDGLTYYLLAPHSTNLGATVETFKMPRNVVGIATGKSSWARIGINTIVTPIEPGWEGTITLEIVNSSPNYVRLYAGVGLFQLLFWLIEDPAVAYCDRPSDYQGQTGITPSKI